MKLLDEVIKEYLVEVIKLHKGNVTDAALTAGIARATMYRKLELYGINHHHYREGFKHATQ